MPSMKNVLGIIMGGGRGSRLYPLTKMRAKPAVPIAGKYRLIDIPLSNCINSGINKISVLTQFKSVSLHRHISRTFIFDVFSSGWVQIFAAEQRDASSGWYQGTADAVRKQLLEIESADAKNTLILAGDHLYRMEYDKLAEFHWDSGADITVAVKPVHRDQASRFGLVKVGTDQQIDDFVEKSTDPAVLKSFAVVEDNQRPYLGSMGIYMFNTDVLIEMLNEYDDTDFGGEVIPRAIGMKKVFAYMFDGYWEDIGTIRSFYDTNIALTQPDTPFSFTHPSDPIYTRARFLPGSYVENAIFNQVVLADGCKIFDSKISDSVIGLRSRISEGAEIQSSIIMGADYYEKKYSGNNLISDIRIGIGPGSQIEGAIIDKNVRMGKNVTIKPFPPGTEIDTDIWSVRDGIVVVPKRSVIPDGSYIGP
ncbi:MAG: glucose-1-phosphate adenylyltransferase [Chloroflexota bacterium]